MKPTSAERRERLILNKDQGKKDSQKDSQQSSSLYELSRKFLLIFQIISIRRRPFSETKIDFLAT
jgi:chromosome segregation and condensation protein ScpB